MCVNMKTCLSDFSSILFFVEGPKTHSRLIINDVIKEDSGNYTCSAPNTLSSSIDVFVSPGKNENENKSKTIFKKYILKRLKRLTHFIAICSE